MHGLCHLSRVCGFVLYFKAIILNVCLSYVLYI